MAWLQADHRGIDSHGIARLHAYFTLLQAGEINPRPQVRKTRSTSTTATVDGDNGLGLIVGPKANKIAMDMADEHGSGWVSVKNTNHYGIAGWYSLQAVERDQVILPPEPAVSNEGGSSPLLALVPAVSWPWVPACGSLEPRCRDGCLLYTSPSPRDRG